MVLDVHLVGRVFQRGVLRPANRVRIHVFPGAYETPPGDRHREIASGQTKDDGSYEFKLGGNSLRNTEYLTITSRDNEYRAGFIAVRLAERETVRIGACEPFWVCSLQHTVKFHDRGSTLGSLKLAGELAETYRASYKQRQCNQLQICYAMLDRFLYFSDVWRPRVLGERSQQLRELVSSLRRKLAPPDRFEAMREFQKWLFPN